MPKISPQAVIDPSAKLASDVEVGPFCMVGPGVTLGARCRLISHVTILGRTTIGARNVFYPNCVIGGEPQDLKYKGEPTSLEMGDNNQIREAVTIHTGTTGGGGVTRVGSNNLLMVNAHVGHDSTIGDGCVVANNVMLAGHVVMGNHVVMSAGAAAHHYVRIGDHVFIGAYSRIHLDVPHYVKIQDDTVWDTNTLGLQRSGFGGDDIDAIEDAIRRLFISKKVPFAQAIAEFDTMNGINPHVKKLVEFLRERDMGKHGRYLEKFRDVRR
jgi:UDP-N-acetylglucosamine acyltransferase